MNKAFRSRCATEFGRRDAGDASPAPIALPTPADEDTEANAIGHRSKPIGFAAGSAPYQNPVTTR